MQSFHQHNSKKMIEKVIFKLNSEQIISLISDAGTPTISDPGHDLIQACIGNNIKVHSLPGPSAVISSLVSSGISSDQFSFLGFFPRETKKQKIFSKRIEDSLETIVFFESPKRILKTLNNLERFLQGRKISIVRELTKINEEIINGNIEEVTNKLKEKNKILGEITVIISASYFDKKKEVSDEEILDYVNELKTYNLSNTIISKLVSKKYKISKRRVYQLIIGHKI